MPIGKIIQNPKIASLEHITRILIQFSPFSTASINARMLITMLQARSLIRTNTRASVHIRVKHDLSYPSVEVEYVDKSKWLFAPHKFSTLGLMRIFEERRVEVGKAQKV